MTRLIYNDVFEKHESYDIPEREVWKGRRSLSVTKGIVTCCRLTRQMILLSVIGLECQNISFFLSILVVVQFISIENVWPWFSSNQITL